MVALGLISVLAAVLLLLVEAHLSTGGLIASVAVVALVSGVALLLVGAAASMAAVIAVAGGVGVASLGGLVLLIRSVGPIRRAGPRTGSQAMVGHIGVMRAGGSAALVYVDGGLWRTQPSPLEAENALHDGDKVVVEHVNGLTLYVRKADELELNQ